MAVPAAAPVAIAVVSWNTRELLNDCLLSLAPEADAGRAEVWVVDNASSDGSAELVREQHPWARLIASHENLGFGPAVNLVAQKASSPWIAPANADIRLQPHAIQTLLEAGERHPRAGIVAPRLVLDDGATQHSVYSFPTLRFALIFNSGLASANHRLADHFALEGRWDHTRARYVDWAIGAFALVRRSAWDAVGGFSSHQWMYAEDLDLGWRIMRAGWKTYYEPNAVVNHRASASTAQLWGDERIEQWMLSTYAWSLRRRGVFRTRAVALVNVVGAFARVIVLTPAAWIAPQRWDWRRQSFIRWGRRHAVGLSSRKRLRDHR